MLEPVSRSPLVSFGVHDVWQKLSVDRLLLVTLSTRHVRNCRQIAFSQIRWSRYLFEDVVSSPFDSHAIHGAWQNLNLGLLLLVNLSTMNATICFQIAFSYSPWPRCMLANFSTSPFFNHFVQDRSQKLSLYRLQLVTMTQSNFRNGRQIAFSQPRWPRCFLNTVARWP